MILLGKSDKPSRRLGVLFFSTVRCCGLLGVLLNRSPGQTQVSSVRPQPGAGAWKCTCVGRVLRLCPQGVSSGCALTACPQAMPSECVLRVFPQGMSSSRAFTTCPQAVPSGPQGDLAFSDARSEFWTTLSWFLTW